MLSFEIDESSNAIQVCCDDNGLDLLISELMRLKGNGKGEHIHLRAPSAGGRILSDHNPWGTRAVGEVIVSLQGDE